MGVKKAMDVPKHLDKKHISDISYLHTIYRRAAAEATMFGHYRVHCNPREFRAKWGWDASFMNGFFGAEGRPRGRWRGGTMAGRLRSASECGSGGILTSLRHRRLCGNRGLQCRLA